MSHILRNGFRPERERNLEEPGSGGLGQGTQMTSVFTAIETPAVGDVFRVEKKKAVIDCIKIKKNLSLLCIIRDSLS